MNQPMLAFFSFGGGELILLFLAGLVLCVVGLIFAFWIWMLVDCIRNERISSGEKVAWVLVIALTHLLGALIYFFVHWAGRPHGTAMNAGPPR